MAVLIREVISEVLIERAPADERPGTATEPQQDADVDLETIVRRAAERVIEQLRREWEQ